MTTAQEFRDAAGFLFLRQRRDSEVSEMRDLLLAAAEQAEQATVERSEWREQIRLLVAANHADGVKYASQIATLTAERDELAGWKAGALVSFSKWYQLANALLPFADMPVGQSLPSELARQIPALLGTLTAERDEARALLAGSFDARWATILPSDEAKAAK